MGATPFTPQFFKRLQQLKIHTRKAFLGSRQGSHRSIRKGHGLEFNDFRPYSPGDDFRHIDWGVYARSDRLYVRQFREEQDLSVAVLLDTSASMNTSGKFELSKQIAQALGYVALTEGDTVTFSLLGQGNMAKLSGARSIARASKAFENAQASGSIDLLHEVRTSVARMRMPGRCFLVSDFMLDVNQIMDSLTYLLSRNFEVSVLQILSPEELKLEIHGAQRVIDAETGEEIDLALDSASVKEYAQKLAKHIETIEHFCQSSGIHHVLLSSAEDVSDIVLKKLPSAGILK